MGQHGRVAGAAAESLRFLRRRAFAVVARIRTVGKLKSVEIKGNRLEIVNELTVEIKDQDKPV
ncbi:MAG: hypothetical protein ACO377_11840 [Pseudomonadales bacterium]